MSIATTNERHQVCDERVSFSLFDAEEGIGDQNGKGDEHRKTGDGKAGVDAARHQYREGEKLSGADEADERRGAKGHIDEKIDPIDVGACDKDISAIGVHHADRGADVYGDIPEQLPHEPCPRKGDRGELEGHDDAAGVIDAAVPEQQVEKTERTDKEIGKRPENVRAARDRVRIEQRGFSVQDVEEMLDKRANLRREIIARHDIIGPERIYLGHGELKKINEEGNQGRKEQIPALPAKVQRARFQGDFFRPLFRCALPCPLRIFFRSFLPGLVPKSVSEMASGLSGAFVSVVILSIFLFYHFSPE